MFDVVISFWLKSTNYDRKAACIVQSTIGKCYKKMKVTPEHAIRESKSTRRSDKVAQPRGLG